MVTILMHFCNCLGFTCHVQARWLAGARGTFVHCLLLMDAQADLENVA